jgi:hypothetical protein
LIQTINDLQDGHRTSTDPPKANTNLITTIAMGLTEVIKQAASTSAP